MLVHARCRALVASVALMCLSAGCGAAVTPGEDIAPKTPAGLETFYGQELAFGPCADYAITLVVSITGDPASPHEGGTALAETLEAELVTVQGERHGAVLVAGNSCVDDAVAAYLISTEAPADARCTL